MRRVVTLLLFGVLATGCAVDEEVGSSYQTVFHVDDTSFVAGGAVEEAEEQYFTVDVPADAIGIEVKMSGSNDADLHTALGQLPTVTTADCAPGEETSDELCIYLSSEGEREIGLMVKGYAPGLSEYLIEANWGISTSP